MIWQQGRAAMQPSNQPHPQPDAGYSNHTSPCLFNSYVHIASALMSGCMTGRRMQPEIIIKMQRRPILCVCSADI
jgi:hypothetical protein